MSFTPNPTLISKSLADASHRHTSFDPEKRATQEIEGFVQHVQDVYDSMQKYAKTDAEKAVLDSEMERYQAGYAQKYNTDLAAKGRTFSSMITGGSNLYGTYKAVKSIDVQTRSSNLTAAAVGGLFMLASLDLRSKSCKYAYNE